MTSKPKYHSLIFIRENEGQLTGSDCCGKMEGDWRVENGQPIFEEQRKVISTIAPLFLAIKDRFKDKIEISIVDPRNQLFLFPKIFRDFLCYKRFSFAVFRSLFMMYRLPAIIINGELKYSGKLPSESELIAQLDRMLVET